MVLNQRTSDGNVVLSRLVCSIMAESRFDAEKLQNLYSFYGSDIKSMEKCIRELIYSCEIKKLSWRTFGLANLAIRYFKKIIEENGGTDMATLIEMGESLFIICPNCGSVMEHSKTIPSVDEMTSVFLYECKDCDCLLEVAESQVEHYSSIENVSEDIFGEMGEEDIMDYGGVFEDDITEEQCDTLRETGEEEFQD